MIKNLHKTDIGREGTVWCEPFQKEIEIFLPDDEVTIKYAEKCIDAMNHMSSEMLRVICKAAKAYCLKFMYEIDDTLDDEMTVPIREDTPEKEILKCFSPTCLIIETPDDISRIGYQLECDCDWEIEHGMEIDILDDKVVYLSAFDGYSPWSEYDNGEWNFVNAV